MTDNLSIQLISLAVLTALLAVLTFSQPLRVVKAGLNQTTVTSSQSGDVS